MLKMLLLADLSCWWISIVCCC